MAFSRTYYKYRSLSNWKYFTDILVSRRLYAAPFQTLNDPMEGLLFFFDDKVTTRYRSAIRKASSRLNICSLSSHKTNSLLWSYYADGHTGVAIGVKVLHSTSPRVDEPQQVTYDMHVSIDSDTETSRTPGAIAKRVLSQKLDFWRHEDEFRVFTTQQYVPVRIKEILLGCMVSETNATAVRELTAKLAPSVPVVQLKRGDLDWPGFLQR